MSYFIIALLAFAQNISFSLVSRSRNRDHKTYHVVSSILANGVWFLTMRELVLSEITINLFVPYVLGAVVGSVFGMSIAMKIESIIGAFADPK